MIERFNKTLKAMLRKHAVRFSNQWDTYLSSILWAYRNTPHESTGEKPSFLMFGLDLRSPTEAVYLNPSTVKASTVEDYKEKVMLSLSSARDLAVEAIRKSRNRYKHQYDRKAVQTNYCVGDWIFIKFPAVEIGKNRKLSQPWQGPYRILQRNDPDITASKVYFPDDGQIQVHQQRVTRCPPGLVAGYYWYGATKHSFGKTPLWVQSLCAPPQNQNENNDIGTTENTDKVEESQPENDDANNDEDEIDDGSILKSCDSASHMTNITSRQQSDKTCPYTLRKRIKTPKRYQQA